MLIKGLQKTTLLDYPGMVACTIFTGGCNFRCPFCHNASLVVDKGNLIPIDSQRSNRYTEEEIFAFLGKRQGILDGVCITGGEPMIQKDLEQFIGKVKDLGFLVKLDTNGSDPERLEKMIEKKMIDYVAMDIKNCKEDYGKTIGIENFNTANIEKSVEILMRGHVPYEFRTTVVKEYHNEEQIRKIGKWIKGADQYYLQQFVDSGDLIGAGLHAWEPEILYTYRDILAKDIRVTDIRGVE